MKEPNPGSDEALDLGCICPVLDNGHGKGSMYGKDVFIYTVGCPVHKMLKGDEDGNATQL